MAQRVPVCSEMEAFGILDRLLCILHRDPLIDEVGFIHPSQLMMLKEVIDTSSSTSMEHEIDTRLESSKDNIMEGDNAIIWSKEHKLGISTEYLLPLYKAAKQRFMESYMNYKKHLSENEGSSNEEEVMKHSKALLMLSSDFGPAWNARKHVISMREIFSLSDELHVSSLVLSFAPKSENAWNYRKWAIKRIAGKCPTLDEILGEESKLVEKIAEKSKMNYRAWNHRCWLISYMSSEQVLSELNTNRNWAALHIADNSCFHFRRKLMLRVLGDVSNGKVEVAYVSQFDSLQQLWKDELDWNEVLIRRYIGREALWLHRRFLSVQWVKHFGISQHPSEKSDVNNNVAIFIDNEIGLFRDCSSLPESMFEDVQSQAIHSASYILWLNKEILSLSSINLSQKLGVGDFRTWLNKLCPEKIRVWDCLLTA